MKPQIPLKLAGLTALATATLSAPAAVTVAGSATANTTSGVASSLTIPSFDLAVGNALAVIVNSEFSGGTPAYSVSFGGVTLTENTFSNEGAQGSGIFWVLNPSITSGDVVVNLGGSSTAAVTVLSLAEVTGVSASLSDGLGAGAHSLSYTGLNQGLAVAGFVDNTFNGSAPTITGGNVDTYTQQLNWNFGGATSSGIAQGYGSIEADGTFSETFTPNGTSGSSRNAFSVVAFVPEPSVSLLGAGGLFLLLGRRRRA